LFIGPACGYNSSMPTSQLDRDTRVTYTPTDEEIDSLIDKAKKHPLGLKYIKEGETDSIASTFAVHAFVVDSAREKLG